MGLNVSPTPACRGKASKLSRSNGVASPLQMLSHSRKQLCAPASCRVQRAVDFLPFGTVVLLSSAISDQRLPALFCWFCFAAPPPPELVSHFRRRRLSKIQSDAAASFTNLRRCKQTSAPLRSGVTLASAAITRTCDLQTTMQICFFFLLFCCGIQKVTHIALNCLCFPLL